MNNALFSGLEWVPAAKIMGRKIVAHQRAYLSKVPRHLKFHPRYYDYILGVSKAVEGNLRDLGANLTNYATFYDRIDINEFRGKLSRTSKEIRKEFTVQEDQPLIGIVGNFQRWKGQITVVEAVKALHPKYPNLKCLLIGEFSYKHNDDLDYYKELIDKIRVYNLQSNILLTGYRNDIPDILNALDIFIHASITPEPYGLVVLEAMAMGKAVIASNEGGPVEMIINGVSGILVKPNDPEILAEKLELLLCDKKLCEELGKNAFQRVKEKFSKIDIDFIENLYKDLLTK